MNRSKLFFVALLLSSAMAGPMLASQAPKPENKATPKAPAGGKNVTSSTPHTSTAAKCGRCVVGAKDAGGKKATTPVTAGKKGPALDKKGVDTGHLHAADGGRAGTGKDFHLREPRPGGESHHGPDGRRQIRVERADHSVLVASRSGHGYIQRSFSYHGHEFDHRTYYDHGVARVRFYRPYYYRGVALHVYAPGLYYAPAFYGWAYAPWRVPVIWSWGWAGNPWYRYYGGWFTPYPVYTHPSLWLTDYLVAETLQAAYEERAAARRASLAADFASTPMTPEVKQAIAEEVRRQIALENAEATRSAQEPLDPASSGLARMLSDRTAHVFVAADGLDVMSNGGECALTAGDVIQLNGPTAPNAVNASLVVLASKGGDCRKGSIVSVGLADLQEMQNHMRETLDQGLAELHSKQGRLGLPAAPPSAVRPPVQTEFAAIAPPPDPNGEAEIRKQAAEAGKMDARQAPAK